MSGYDLKRLSQLQRERNCPVWAEATDWASDKIAELEQEIATVRAAAHTILTVTKGKGR